jgi:hypothetical protein
MLSNKYHHLATPRVDRQTLGEAWGSILEENSGLKCPEGCGGCAVRVFGLFSHLTNKHRWSRKKANRYLKSLGFVGDF